MTMSAHVDQCAEEVNYRARDAEDEWEVTANGCGVSSGKEENILKLVVWTWSVAKPCVPSPHCKYTVK